MVPIHFPGLNPSRRSIALVEALGLAIPADKVGLTSRRFDALRAAAPLAYFSSDPDTAALWIYPHNYPGDEAAAALADMARQARKPIIFFRPGDELSPTSLAYGTVYRDSISAVRAAPHERVAPALVSDPLLHIQFRVQPYTARPTVGFCGYTGRVWLEPAYRFMRLQEKARGLRLRRKVLSTFRKSKNVDSKFVERTQFWGGAVRLQRRRLKLIVRRIGLMRNISTEPELDLDTENRVYNEFLQNIAGTQYTLCPRGAGNFSFRFYETLAAGRIPIFVNTDSLLPLADRIDWAQHAVLLNEHEIDSAPDRLLGFHRAMTPERFEEIQRSNRSLWERYLSPTAFYATLIEDQLSRSV